MNECWHGVIICAGVYILFATVSLAWLYCACRLSHKGEENSDGSLRDRLYK